MMRLLLASALASSLAFLLIDTTERLQLVRERTELTLDQTSPPQPSSTSPSGYAAGQHRLILPSGGPDGYHWILQTERMFAGDGLRIREARYDNAPDGREVHWSSSLRWWLGSVALLYQRLHPELTLPLALERVAPWANAVLLGVLLLLFALLLARALGPLAGALMALAGVAVFPFYQLWIAGLLDHHGLAAVSGFATVIFLVAGGGGWVRAATPARADDRDRTGWPWLRAELDARRWFIASAVAGGAGLWISAATVVPVLLGIGVAALVSCGLLARTTAKADFGAAPQLWRTWGIAGCLTSLACYALEYFPAHIGWRLEVNHPLYALAWLAGGDLLSRLAPWLATKRRKTSTPQRRKTKFGIPSKPPAAWRWIVLDCAAVLLLPVVIGLTRASTFRVTDPFLWAMHADYIAEFDNYGALLASLAAAELPQLALPVVLLPLAALLWSTTSRGAERRCWHVLLGALVCIALIFLHGIFFYAGQPLLRALGLLPADPASARLVLHAFAFLALAALGTLLAWVPARSAGSLPPPAQAVLVLALLPAVALLALAYQQQRWMGIAFGLLLAPLVTAAAVLTCPEAGFVWTRPRLVVAALCFALILLPFPARAVLSNWRHGYFDPAVHQLIARDIASFLRRRIGDRSAVVLSAPTTTSWLIYFGGFKGVGTLYWENLAGMKAAAVIYAANTDEQARQLIERAGVTHLIVYLWEPFVHEYARLAHGLRLDRAAPTASPNDTFIRRALDPNTRATWLRTVPYDMPDLPGAGAGVLLLEVVRPMTAPP